eukprot:COSAG05_NODE_1629_length_4372_cov_4.107653_7_plen_127_part_00
MAYAMLHLHSADGSNEVNVHTNEDDADSYYWRPHEEALMSITIPPATTKVFCASDYLGCSEFSQLYAARRWPEGHRETLNFGPPHHGEGRNTPSPAWPACLHTPEPVTRLLQTPRPSIPEDYYRYP